MPQAYNIYLSQIKSDRPLHRFFQGNLLNIALQLNSYFYCLYKNLTSHIILNLNGRYIEYFSFYKNVEHEGFNFLVG